MFHRGLDGRVDGLKGVIVPLKGVILEGGDVGNLEGSNTLLVLLRDVILSWIWIVHVLLMSGIRSERSKSKR